MAGHGPVNNNVPPPNRPHHDRYLELYKAIVNGDKFRAMSFIDGDPTALTAGITQRSETPLHLAVSLSRAAHMIAPLLRRITLVPLSSLVDADGNSVLIAAATVQNLVAADLLVTKDRDLLWKLNVHGSNPLIIAAQFGNRRMVCYLMRYWQEQRHRMSEESCLKFVKLLLVAGFYDLVLHILEKTDLLDANAIPECFGSLLKVMAERPVEHNFWDNLYFDQVIKSLCKKILVAGDYSKFKAPILLAAKSGVGKIVEEILKSYPGAIWFKTRKGHNVFHLSAIHRHNNIFGHLCRKYGHKNSAIASLDNAEKNILHLVAEGDGLTELNTVGGPALRMQYELIWYQEVEKQLQPSYRTALQKGESPSMKFTKAHDKLVKAGEKWMKGAATAGSVAATLIATVVFTAIINVPGGSKDGAGSPNLRDSTLFRVFISADGLGLFLSVSSVLMFISILASGFSESAFLFVLPQRLITGLITLIVSLTCMLVAFWSAFLCATGNEPYSTTSWVLLQLTYIPGLLFMVLLKPLLVEMIRLTWLPAYFILMAPPISNPLRMIPILRVLLFVVRFNIFTTTLTRWYLGISDVIYFTKSLWHCLH